MLSFGLRRNLIVSMGFLNRPRTLHRWLLLAGLALGAYGQEDARLQLRWSEGELRATGIAETGIAAAWPEGARPAVQHIEIETTEGATGYVPVRIPDRVFHCDIDPAHGVMGGETFTLDAVDFSVRIPFDASVRSLRFVDGDGVVKGNFDARSLPKSINKMTWPTTKIDNGPDEERLVFAVLGDGYRAEEIGQFQSDAANVIAGFLNEPPWDAYAGLVNVYTVAVESNESGADHPVDDIFVDTALDARYGLPPLQRLLTVNFSKAYQAAASVPTFDLILVIVNDTEYGGSGGPAAVMSLDNAAVDLGLHEMGHKFAGLADEYESACP